MKKFSQNLIETTTHSGIKFSPADMPNWIRGVFPTGERFSAKLFGKPSPQYGIDGGHVLKLWIADKGQTIYNYDRGIDVATERGKELATQFIRELEGRTPSSVASITEYFTPEEAQLAQEYPDEFDMGMEVELEHDEITGGDQALTARIVMDHMNEDPYYYTKLKQMESAASNEDIFNFSQLPEKEKVMALINTGPIEVLEQELPRILHGEVLSAVEMGDLLELRGDELSLKAVHLIIEDMQLYLEESGLSGHVVLPQNIQDRLNSEASLMESAASNEDIFDVSQLSDYERENVLFQNGFVDELILEMRGQPQNLLLQYNMLVSHVAGQFVLPDEVAAEIVSNLEAVEVTRTGAWLLSGETIKGIISRYRAMTSTASTTVVGFEHDLMFLDYEDSDSAHPKPGPWIRGIIRVGKMLPHGQQMLDPTETIGAGWERWPNWEFQPTHSDHDQARKYWRPDQVAEASAEMEAIAQSYGLSETLRNDSLIQQLSSKTAAISSDLERPNQARLKQFYTKYNIDPSVHAENSGFIYPDGTFVYAPYHRHGDYCEIVHNEDFDGMDRYIIHLSLGALRPGGAMDLTEAQVWKLIELVGNGLIHFVEASFDWSFNEVTVDGLPMPEDIKRTLEVGLGLA